MPPKLRLLQVITFPLQFAPLKAYNFQTVLCESFQFASLCQTLDFPNGENLIKCPGNCAFFVQFTQIFLLLALASNGTFLTLLVQKNFASSESLQPNCSSAVDVDARVKPSTKIRLLSDKVATPNFIFISSAIKLDHKMEASTQAPSFFLLLCRRHLTTSGKSSIDITQNLIFWIDKMVQNRHLKTAASCSEAIIADCLYQNSPKSVICLD